MTMRSIFLGMVGAAMLAGCGGDDGEEEPAGTAPVIESLTLDPPQVPVGKQTPVTGRLTFRDAEADANRLAGAVTGPSGTRQVSPPSPTQGTNGRGEGELLFLIAIAPPEEGAYTLEVWMLDEQGNESNHLDAALEAQPSD